MLLSGMLAELIFRTICDNPYYQAFSSVITLIEVLTQPMRQLNSQLVAQYKAFLLRSANFAIYGIDPIIAEKVAELRARYGLKTPDAIQLAVAIQNGGTLFITNDRNLTKLDDIEITVLRNYTV